MLKRIIIIFTLFSIVFTTVSYADDIDEEEGNNIILEQEEIISLAKQVNKKPTINSRKYVVLDRKSGQSIYGKNEEKQTAMASTTKIMTAIVVLENCKNIEEIVTIDTKSASVGGSRLGLKNNDKITVNDLLFGLLMRSGNDSAVALAIHVGGSVEGFAELMNKKAQDLDLKNTHFVTPHGLDDPNHYTTANDLARLTDYALKNNQFATMVKTKYAFININGSQKQLKNTNELLCADYEGVYGVKTGFTNNAGRCLVTAVKRNDLDLIIVTLGADTKKDRGQDTIKLVEYICTNFKTQNLEEVVQEEFEKWKMINLDRIYIEKASSRPDAKLDDIKIKQIVSDKEIKVEIASITYAQAPLEKNTQIGSITVKNGETILEQIPIKCANTILKLNLKDYLSKFARVICL